MSKYPSPPIIVMAAVICFICVAHIPVSAQTAESSIAENPDGLIAETASTKAGMEFMLRFLASDEMRGRMTGEQGNDMAARFIAESFRKYGVKAFDAAPDYLQPVPVKRFKAAESAEIIIGTATYAAPQQLIVMNGPETDLEAGFVFAGHGLSGDWDGVDARDRIILVRFGRPDQSGIRGYQQAMAEKIALAKEHGAAGIIELYDGTGFEQLSGTMTRPRYILDDPGSGSNDIPFLIIDNTGGAVKNMADGTSSMIRLKSSGLDHSPVRTHNVAGYVEGSDPHLKDEYLLLMAHFDHTGVQRGPLAASMADTVFNGARDNAMGTVALMNAARSFAANPAPRSVIFLAVTAEEIGLMGSRHYTHYPLAPLEQTVFVLNSDGAGYTDTTIVTVVGLGRTTADDVITNGVRRFGLEAIPDPVPQQNLFNRSDNVNFARLGIPAPTYSPGFRDFGPDLIRTYHTVEDRPEDVDFNYLYRFSGGFVKAARGIASMPERPQWTPGDVYEEAFFELYGRE